jgi:tetratricopeptide (TPR) repeat protein
MIYYAMGRKAESDAALSQAKQNNGDAWPSEIARIYAFRGELDNAMEWLNRAFDFKDEDLYDIRDDPLVSKLEGDPRYKSFLKKMNLSL